MATALRGRADVLDELGDACRGLRSASGSLVCLVGEAGIGKTSLILTASEEAIVELVGQGLTNTEIGRRLFVSRRTVESHLGRVYPKLGLSSRAQPVAAVTTAPVDTLATTTRRSS